VNYYNTVKVDNDRPYSDLGVVVHYNPAPVTPDIVRNYGVKNFELSPHRPELGLWSVQVTFRTHF
jgi:hypothetical protein